MDIKLYNTLSRKKEIFSPAINDEVRMYACGPTVYEKTHIGHFRAYIFVDILRRMILYNGLKLKHVMNITDVGHLTDDADLGEDKIEKKAMKENKSVWEISKFYTKYFFSSMDKINVERPDIICKATDHIKEMIEMVKLIEKNGYAYTISDGVYFDTSKLKDYGKLAHIDLKNLQEGARVEPNPEKRNITDFALWKFSPTDSKRQMEWDSPWGKGFPGWHIECTAMGVKYLGKIIDIHTGGIDHIPVHHTNEIAQAQGAFGGDIVRFWMHNEFVLVDGEKMSKSKGNFYTMEDIENLGFNPLSVRYFFLQAHYRSPVNFTWKALEGAEIGLNRIYDKVREIKSNYNIGKIDLESKIDTGFKEEFLKAINNDLNTSKALSVLWKVLKDKGSGYINKISTILDFDKILGLKIRDVIYEDVKIPKEVNVLLKQRERARRLKDFELSDKLRDKVLKLGFVVQDTKEGQVVKKRT